MLIVRYCRGIAILRDLKYIGKIDLDIIHQSCKNGLTIHGRYSQQVGNTVYAVDRHGRLYRIEWQDSEAACAELLCRQSTRLVYC